MYKSVLIVFFVSLLSGCGNDSTVKESSTPSPDTTLVSDSILIERYFAWQDSIEYTDDDDNYYKNTIRDHEKIRDTILITYYAQQLADSLTKRTGLTLSLEEWAKYLHTIDLNGDNQLDLIYEGQSGGEPFLTEFFLIDTLGIKKIFSGYQVVTKMNFKEAKLSSFSIINPGCCTDPAIVEYFYTIKFDSSKVSLTLVNTLGYLNRLEKPTQKLSAPVAFTLKKISKLRCEAASFDGFENPVWGNEGNSISLYSIGSKGIVYGSKRYQDEEWLYVSMNPESKPVNSEFPQFLEQPTQLYGWIRKEDTDLYPD
ncbi:hypothetical protein [Xanthocytophaga flava]|uniref:hypothetical protein n=1 Tax=Xanthocytophaga flava TaxID=3048013 RepID=UPI0028D4871E|nr:hypothetical protein [Xanthocytophaga flavus]MDJ1469502.1 hypothetical protein [Xanthocytophaga flavus]